jgi:hypothetical protein
LALRFYLAMRSALRANEILQERLMKAERKNRAADLGNIENPDKAHAVEPAADPPSDRAVGHHG